MTATTTAFSGSIRNSPVSLSRSSTPAIQASVGAVVTLAFALLCQLPAVRTSPLYTITNALASAAFVAAGLLVATENDKRSLSKALILAGILWATQWTEVWKFGPFPMISDESNAMFFVICAWGALSYPDGHPLGRFERAFLVSVLAIPFWTFLLIVSSRPEWSHFDSSAWWPAIWANHKAFTVVTYSSYVVDLVLAITFTITLRNRLSHMIGIDQIVAKPIAMGFCLFSLFVSLTQVLQPYPSSQINAYYFLFSAALLAVPLSILIATIHRQLRHAAIADGLHRHFSRKVATIEVVRDALREALNDPSLDVLCWSPELHLYVDADGTTSTQPSHAPHQLIRQVTTRNGEPLAVIIANLSNERHKHVLDTAVNAGGIALENAQLHASVSSQLEEVSRSRARIAEATLKERRRLERDLHDGVQQRLLALGARLGTVRHTTSDDQARETIGSLSRELQLTMEDLRGLVHRIHPTELRQFGLRDAINVMTEGSSLDVALDIESGRFPEDVEIIAYFVICESLANVTKHAQTNRASVRVFIQDSWLVVEVSDEGNGKADMNKGSGITGLRDRVQTVGGELTLEARLDIGTTVKARIPCA